MYRRDDCFAPLVVDFGFRAYKPEQQMAAPRKPPQPSDPIRHLPALPNVPRFKSRETRASHHWWHGRRVLDLWRLSAVLACDSAPNGEGRLPVTSPGEGTRQRVTLFLFLRR